MMLPKLLIATLLIAGCAVDCPSDRAPTSEEQAIFAELATCAERSGAAPRVSNPVGYDCGRAPDDLCVQCGSGGARGCYSESCQVAAWARSQPPDRAAQLYRHEALHSLIGDFSHCSRLWCDCVGECREEPLC